MSHHDETALFDPRVADWLEGDPDRAPRELLATVLAAVPSIAQRRAVRMPGLFRGTMRPAYAIGSAGVAALAIIALAGSGLLGPQSGASNGPTVSTTPSAAPSSTASEPSAGPAAGAWTSVGDMVEIRFGASVTALANGQVLVAGGESDGRARQGMVRATAELFDPATGRWTLTGPMHAARWSHAAVRLLNGQVLVIGGLAVQLGGAPSLSSAELFDPSTGTWTETGSLVVPRANATATVLANGKVLVTGGVVSVATLEQTATAELFDPATGRWTETAPMSVARTFHTATLLPDGRVLVAGGGCCGQRALASAELFDPNRGTWSRAADLGAARRLHTAILLNDGRVLVYGGNDYGVPAVLAELYDPATDSWVRVAGPRNDGAGAALADGRVLVKGPEVGELFDPRTRSWSTIGGPSYLQTIYTATPLLDGRVLVTFDEHSAVFDPRGLP